MSRYLDSKCLICEHDFCENDDIVVCPQCGTPYHRECYGKIGECINKEYHIQGKSWKPDKKFKKIDEVKVCADCGTQNSSNSINCKKCGAILADTPVTNNNKNSFEPYEAGNTSEDPRKKFFFDPSDKCCGMNPKEEFDSVRLEELADFVKSNQLYYLPIFKKIKDTGKKFSLNIVSFLFPELYFANRKMWFWSAVSVIISTILSLPSVIYLLAGNGVVGGVISTIDVKSDTFEFIYSLSSYVNFVFKALAFLFANWLYYKHALKKINQQKKFGNQTNPDKLSSAGGTSIAGIFISFSAEMFLFMLILVFLTK